MKDINQIIEERRSIFPREYTGERVSDDVIHQLLKNAHCAPSHRSSFAWKFLIFADEAKVKLFEYWQKNAPNNKIEKLKNNCTKTSHLIIIVAQDKGKNPLEEEKASVACAVQNMYLSLSQYPNVGGYWGSGNGCYSQEFAKFLSLNENEHCMGYFILGSVKNKRTKAERPPFNSNVTWVK